MSCPRLEKPCILHTGYIMPNGYGQVRREGQTWLAHRWAARVAHGPALGRVVRHKCDVRRCIEPEHLEYGTQGDNLIDRRERHRYRKLTRADAEQIRALLPGAGNQDIADSFGVSRTMIAHIRTGRQWPCLTSSLT